MLPGDVVRVRMRGGVPGVGFFVASGNARNLFRAGARVTFFSKRKGPLRRLRRERRSRPEGRAPQARVKKTLQCRGKSAVWEVAGIFRRGVLPRRKTADIVSAALRVSGCGRGRRCGQAVWTKRGGGGCREPDSRSVGKSRFNSPGGSAMTHPDNPFGPFKGDDHRLEAVKVDAVRQIVLSIMDKGGTVIVVIAFLVFMWFAPEKALIALEASGLVKGLSAILKH